MSTTSPPAYKWLTDSGLLLPHQYQGPWLPWFLLPVEKFWTPTLVQNATSLSGEIVVFARRADRDTVAGFHCQNPSGKIYLCDSENSTQAYVEREFTDSWEWLAAVIRDVGERNGKPVSGIRP